MLKQDIVNRIAETAGRDYLKRDVAQGVDILLETMRDALVEGRRIEIRGFGGLRPRTRKAKTIKNPKTGKIMQIPVRKNILFSMSKDLKEALIEEG